MNDSAPTAVSPWPHRAAVVLCCATFPLLWIGGLVTSTDAGMAVPDWPTTFGYNMFLYPWQTWFFGPWDLFIEHGHRLFASGVGMIAIALVFFTWRYDNRLWIKQLVLVALVLVITQGVLGGMRVEQKSRTFAMLHGCGAAAFFALTAAIVVFTSRTWRSASLKNARSSKTLFVIALLLAAVVYVQIVFGAMLRHVPDFASPRAFASSVHMHLGMVPVISLLVFSQAWLARRTSAASILRRLSTVLVAVLVLQVLLGVGTWLTKYSVPYWASGWIDPSAGAIAAGGWLQSLTATAHVAIGSLMLAFAVSAAIYQARFVRLRHASPNASPLSNAFAGRALA